MNITFNEKNHTYKLDGVRVPSVSTILGMYDGGKSRALAYWAAGLCADYVDENISRLASMQLAGIGIADEVKIIKKLHATASSDAASIGTLAHDYISQHILNKITGYFDLSRPESEEANRCIDSFFEWEFFNNVEYISTESMVASKVHGFAGRLDAVAVINGVPTLLDLKTSNRLYDVYYAQIAGYITAWNEMHDVPKIVDGIILRIPKEGGAPEVGRGFDLKKDSAAFLNMLELYRWSKLKRD